MEINIDNTSKWNANDLPINTYFTSEHQDFKGKILLKVYNGKYVNILNGKEVWDRLSLDDCIIINKLKISIEQF